MEHYNQAYTEAEYNENERIFRNGEARLPIVICIDTSSSMDWLINDKSDYIETGPERFEDGDTVHEVKLKKGRVAKHRIDELKKVFGRMLDKMKMNDVISRAASICIITFNRFPDCIVEFSDLEKISSSCVRQLQTGIDETNVSRGINLALERLDRFQTRNRDAGNDSYRPVLIFMSDGIPTDNEAQQAQREVRQRSEDRNLNVIPVAIGNGLDEAWLRGLTRESRVYHMNKDSEFEEVFSEISERILKATVVIPTDEDDNNMASEVDEDVASTVYGSSGEDFIESFMNT